MGRFSTTLNIKNNSDRENFLKSFCAMMKKRGFVPCSEYEAALSYAAAFSEGSWVTLANEDYRNNPKKAYEDSREIAAALKTSAFSVAVILGIDPYYIDADYDEVLEKADENENITALYFKKAEEKAKAMTLNAAFKQMFGDTLEPLGYKLIKSKYPYFVRVVPGGEIIHVISCEESLCSYPRARKFDILTYDK